MSNGKMKYFDEDEKQLIESIEDDATAQWSTSKPEIKKEIEHAAREFQRARETKMNIRIDREELERIKKQAAHEGLRYQSFVKSVLHRYITGQLIEDKGKKRAG